MYELYDDQREFLLRLSVTIVCAAAAVLPLTVPPTTVVARARAGAPQMPASRQSLPERVAPPVIVVHKDPFVPQGGGQIVASHDAASSDDIGIVLPPNAGAHGLLGSDGMARVRGVVLGDSPEALIDFGSGAKVLGLGDVVGSDAITRIDALGVVLKSGVRLNIVRSPR